MSWPSTDAEVEIQERLDELDALKKRLSPRIVVFDVPPKGFEDKYPWKAGTCLLFLGEIANMPGHCVLADKAGRVYWGYHTENFREPNKDEI